ncbi:MAG: zinc metallopeptidase [Elainella sp.]
MFYFDPTYFLLIALPTLVLSGLVQAYLRSSFAKWSQVPNTEQMNGLQVAQTLFNRTSLQPIPVERIAGSLTDHFDPHANVVRLSQPIASQPSIAAMAVTAHELGHVQQYQTRSPLIVMRGMLLPALQFTPTISYLAFTMGFLFNAVGLMWIGVLFFSLMVFFSVLTLPIELDASRRALNLLKESGLLDTNEEAKGARQVLNAAALTYLAAAVTSVMQLLYYISLVRQRQQYR